MWIWRWRGSREGGMASRGENNVDAAWMASLIVYLYSLRSSCRVQMNGDGSTSSLSSRSTPLPSPNQQRHRRGQLDILVCVQPTVLLPGPATPQDHSLIAHAGCSKKTARSHISQEDTGPTHCSELTSHIKNNQHPGKTSIQQFPTVHGDRKLPPNSKKQCLYKSSQCSSSNQQEPGIGNHQAVC